MFGKLLITIGLLSLSLCVSSQPDATLGSFTAVEVNGQVLLNWEIAAGSTCNGISIQRSADSTHFSEIGSISGVCGSVSTAVIYNYTDTEPIVNHINFYRLELGNNVSKLISVKVNAIGADGYQLQPNPVSENALLLFRNLEKSRYALTVYSVDGRLALTSATTSESFPIAGSSLAAGMYVFSVINEVTGKLLTGKFLVR